MNVADWAQEHGLRLHVASGPVLAESPDGWRHRAWQVALYLHGARFDTPWRAGLAVEGEPEAAEVLDALILDAEAGGWDFEDFCGEMGYDPDSRDAWKTWEGCRQTRLGLAEFLGGEEFERLLSGEVERL